MTPCDETISPATLGEMIYLGAKETKPERFHYFNKMQELKAIQLEDVTSTCAIGAAAYTRMKASGDAGMMAVTYVLCRLPLSVGGIIQRMNDSGSHTREEIAAILKTYNTWTKFLHDCRIYSA